MLKRITSITILIYTLSGNVIIAKPETTIDCRHSDNTFQCVNFIRNYDGDTITVNIPSVPKIIGEEMGIRIKDIDAPEIRTKNQCEKKKAYEAKQLLYSHLKNAIRIDLNNCTRGKYFRFVCDVIVDGKNISEILLERKLAYPYNGGRKKKIDWCVGEEK